MTLYIVARALFRRGETGQKDPDTVLYLDDDEFERRFSPRDREKLLAGKTIAKVIKGDVCEAYVLDSKHGWSTK